MSDRLQTIDPTSTQLVNMMWGIEAGRRVGWAKYYKADAALGNAKLTSASREGFVLGILEYLINGGVTLDQGVALITVFMEARLDEFGAREAFERGRSDGQRQAIPMSIALGTPVQSTRRLPATLKGDQCRCYNCNKLMAVVGPEHRVYVRCLRCHTENQLGITHQNVEPR